MIDIVTKHLLPHWPFLASLACFAVIGQALKRVWSEDDAKQRRAIRLWRRLLPFHPVITGAVGGVLFHRDLPVSPGVSGPLSVGLYFAAAGALSVWAYAVVRTWAKYKGLELPDLD